MRVVIKNADFSAVSIGKVIRDLSFNYSNGTLLNAIMKNPIDEVTENGYDASSTHNAAATYYVGSSGSESFSVVTNANRIVSELIEVVEGMVISSTVLNNTDSVPSIVCFDSDKNVLPPSKACWSYYNTINSFIIPSGVKYISIQTSKIKNATNIKGVMPST